MIKLEEQCLYDVFKRFYRTDSRVPLVWIQPGRAVAFAVTHPVINPAEGNGKRNLCWKPLAAGGWGGGVGGVK